MATIVNNPGPERVVEVDRSDSSGWAVAVIVLVLVIVGLFLWYRYYHTAPPAQNGSANINVTFPSGNSGGNSSGGTSGNGTGY